MVDRQPYTFDRVIRILFGVVSVVGLFYLVYILRGALLPFLVAWIVAYMLNPLVVYLQFFEYTFRPASRT